MDDERASEFEDSELSLVARDPLSLVAHWSLATSDAGRVRASADRHLVLRVFEAVQPDRLLAQMHLPGDRRIQQVDIPVPGHPYRAELGVFGPAGDWCPFARSGLVQTPVAEPTPEPLRPASTPEVSFPETVGLPPHPENDIEPPIELLSAESGDVSLPEFPDSVEVGELSPLPPPSPPTVATVPGESDLLLIPIPPAIPPERSLCAAVHSDLVLRPSEPASSEALLQQAPDEKAASGGVPAAELSLPSSHEHPSGERSENPFWFHINADLVIYGGTKPDARVVIAGEPVALRPDGTFTLRFTLPDGEFLLDAAATSADGTASREVTVRVRRVTTA